MRAIKSRNTKPELLVRKGLHAAGFRYSLHGKKLPGKPDIVLPRYRTVVFIHGCFWHRHDCEFFKIPKTRTEFWMNKIGSNQKRDAANTEKLLAAGWNVITVWECSVRAGHAGLTDRLANMLRFRLSDASAPVASVCY